jgi:hypothetical protein
MHRLLPTILADVIYYLPRAIVNPSMQSIHGAEVDTEKVHFRKV